MDKTNNVLQPGDAFKSIKESINNITVEGLQATIPNIMKMAEKFKKTNQKKALGKLLFLTSILEKEQKVIELGINKFVYKDVIEDYIDHVDKDVIKCIELERYQRIIPDEIVEIVEKTKDLFDRFYVVYTDYTGKDERKVEQYRRDKDPILFGCFCDFNDRLNRYVADRFYVLGDWVDEYCDLTIDKMVDQYSKTHDGESPINEIKIPNTFNELYEELSKYKEVTDKDKQLSDTYSVKDFMNDNNDTYYQQPIGNNEKKKPQSIFSKARSFLKF